MEDNIKMNLQEISCEGMNWIRLSQNTDKWYSVVDTLTL